MQSPIDDLDIAEVRLVVGSGLRDKLDGPCAVEFAFRIRARYSGNRCSDTHAGQDEGTGPMAFDGIPRVWVFALSPGSDAL